MANMGKKYKDIKLPEEIAKIINEQIVGREEYRSRSEYVVKTILQDLDDSRIELKWFKNGKETDSESY